jgi:hypothetical protein
MKGFLSTAKIKSKGILSPRRMCTEQTETLQFSCPSKDPVSPEIYDNRVKRRPPFLKDCMSPPSIPSRRATGSVWFAGKNARVEL